MHNKIYPCIWFDGNAREAADFYCSIFQNANIKDHNTLVVTFEIEGQKFMCLNGGPQFKPNPSISFYVTCETETEIDGLWKELLEDGKALMPLNKYDWSEKYGWVNDRYGVSWQLTIGRVDDMGQKITAALMFTGDEFGKAEEAVQFYSSVFKPSTSHFLFRYPETDPLQKGKVAHGQFSLLDQKFIVLDSGMDHNFNFTEGLSLVVDCDSQKEIDHYWDGLSKGGEESMCGWLKDPFGVSWQIVPSVLPELMRDPENGPKVMQAIMKMKKLDIQKLEQA
jgi:predicted 3-demethylubiquinone-9 3-methyltransferase (glyoxalase superfamily)